MEDYDHHYRYNTVRTVPLLNKFIREDYKKAKMTNFVEYQKAAEEEKKKTELLVEDFKTKIQHFNVEDYEDLLSVDGKDKFIMFYSPTCP